MADRAELIERCIPDLRRYALVLCGDVDQADDLVQDTVARALSRWYLRRSENEVRPWLFAIQRNLFLSDRRRASRALRVFDPDAEAADAGIASPEAALELRQVLAMVGALPEEQRSALVLVCVEGFSYREAARILDAPEGTVMSRLSRAREKLRRMTGAAAAQKIRSVK